MKQISNKKNSLSYLYYWMFGYILALEPFFMVRLFNTYLPNFYYRGLTLPISIVLGIVSFQKMRAAVPLPNKDQVYRAIGQIPKILLKPEFWKNILKSSKRFCRSLINSFKRSNSKEPTVEMHRKESLITIRLAVIFSILVITILLYLFVTNLSDFGLLETSLTILGYFYIYLLFIVLCIKQLSVLTIKQNNGRKSANDLEALLCLLRSELEDWNFERRVPLPLEGKKRLVDIDIMAISPEGNYFIIDLKSHIGDVFWHSKSKELRRQYGKNPESEPFEKDFFDQLNAQARRLKTSNKLSKKIQKILLFWRATVKINKKDRVKRGVLISSKESLINDLRKRNNDLS
jgi:hypothetical protein